MPKTGHFGEKKPSELHYPCVHSQRFLQFVFCPIPGNMSRIRGRARKRVRPDPLCLIHTEEEPLIGVTFLHKLQASGITFCLQVPSSSSSCTACALHVPAADCSMDEPAVYADLQAGAGTGKAMVSLYTRSLLFLLKPLALTRIFHPLWRRGEDACCLVAET